MSSPVGEYRIIVDDSGNPRYVNRLLVGTPTTGLVRMEWVAARYGQMIPTNWSQVMMNQFVSGYVPLRYQVAEAQNLIVKATLEGEFEWLLLIEHDTMPPPDAFVRFNQYIQSEEVPVVSGLYFTKSEPSEPILYRGRGNSFYKDWRVGEKVWVDGVPTGMLLIHSSILKVMWEDSEEYLVGNQRTKRVFETPRNQWFSPDSNEFFTFVGTSDLHWCTRVIEGDYFRKAGWNDFMDSLEDQRYPFLVDTNIFCRHIDMDGRQFPTDLELSMWKVPEAPSLGIHVADSLSIKGSMGGN